MASATFLIAMQSVLTPLSIALALCSGAATCAQSLDRAGSLFSPYLEWKLEHRDHAGNPFDVEATAVFTHPASGETRTTGMFYDGEGWKFRFTGTRTGKWTFQTRSSVAALNDKRGTVVIASPVRGKQPRGFVTSVDGNRWAWQTGESTNAVEPFVPQLVMGRDLPAYGDTAKIDSDIQRWLADHGFNGIHIGVLCRWFDFDQISADKIAAANPNPDPRTFEVLEQLITRFHRAGGLVHIWAWGDESRRMTPSKWGINGRADKRLQRYIAARLGPLPGWTRVTASTCGNGSMDRSSPNGTAICIRILRGRICSARARKRISSPRRRKHSTTPPTNNTGLTTRNMPR
jgi:hypothetical protein